MTVYVTAKSQIRAAITLTIAVTGSRKQAANSDDQEAALDVGDRGNSDAAAVTRIGDWLGSKITAILLLRPVHSRNGATTDRLAIADIVVVADQSIDDSPDNSLGLSVHFLLGGGWHRRSDGKTGGRNHSHENSH
jgi:ABC-type sugar transport system substrate-binding protein